MMKERTDKGVETRLNKAGTMYRAAMVCTTLLAAVFLLAPVVNYSKEEGSTLSGILLSSAVWALTISTAVLVQRSASIIQSAAQNDPGPPGKAFRKKELRFLRLAANRGALISEIAAAAGILLWICRAVGWFRPRGALRMLQYSLTFGGLLMHLLFSGKYYIYIRKREKYIAGKRGKENEE